MEFIVFASILMLILGGAYWLIKERLALSQRRILLLSLPFLAVIAVFIKGFLVKNGVTVVLPVVQMDTVTIESQTVVDQGVGIDWSQIYFTGVAIMLLLLLVKLSKILYFFRGAVPYIADPSKRILIGKSNDSFSFFNRIHLSAYLGEDERTVVLEHELLHCNKFHSIDLILMEIYQALFWFNPLMILMKRELVRVHEFQVDEEMYRKYDHSYLQHLLSFSLGTTVAHLLLTSQFNGKMNLAQRIKKMKNKKRKLSTLIMVIPVVLLGFVLISWTSTSSSNGVNSMFQNYEKPPEGDVDKEPQYKGGQSALIEFLSENVKYPEVAEKKGIEGTVFVGFIVETDGHLSGISVKKSANPLLDDEALRVVKLMPVWEPGEKDGKPVKVEMTLPINFKLS